MEEPDDVDFVHLGEIFGGGVFSWFEADAASVCGTGHEDIDLANRLEDFGHTREVGLRSGVGLDLGFGVGLLERLFGGSED